MLDDTSFAGKVVGSVHDWCTDANVSHAAIVGEVDAATDPRDIGDMTVVSLVETVGREASMAEPLRSIEDAARGILAKMV